MFLASAKVHGIDTEPPPAFELRRGDPEVAAPFDAVGNLRVESLVFRLIQSTGLVPYADR